MVSMSPDHVATRLRLMSAESAAGSSAMPDGVDMSSAAVGARLRDLAELSELCWQLATARPR